MIKETPDSFAILLEKAGYEGALNLVQDVLIPLAEKGRLSLYEAAWKWADNNEDEDTSWYRLWITMRVVEKDFRAELEDLDIYGPVES